MNEKMRKLLEKLSEGDKPKKHADSALQAMDSSMGAHAEFTGDETTITDKSLVFKESNERPVALTGKRYPPMEGKPYFNAYSDGFDPVFVWRDQAGKKRVTRVPSNPNSPDSVFTWYFYVKTAEWEQKVSRELIEKHRKTGAYIGHELDDVNPEWTKVFCIRATEQTLYMKDRSGNEIGMSYEMEKLKKFPRDYKWKMFLNDLEAVGVGHYEADLTPRQRFATDYDIDIENTFRELYFDIETDDRMAGFGRMGDGPKLWERRILSIAWRYRGLDGVTKPGYVELKEDTNDAERDLLMVFRRQVEVADVMYAWNGLYFDFPIVQRRMRMRGLDYDWRFMVKQDLLAVFRRYHQRAASAGTSFGLGDIGKAVVNMPKLDWRDEVKRVCRGCHEEPPKKFYDLWKKHPEILRKYNERDVEVLEKLEAHTGYGKLDQVFCKIGNCPPNDFHISTKIDMLMLKKAKVRGIHFPSAHLDGDKTHKGRYDQGRREGTYEGAFVFPPVIGIHEGVAAVDFKSLYPSMMVLFNISPETYVRPEDVDQYDPKDLITCPTGAKFKKSPDGFITEIFNVTLEKRKVYQKAQLEEEVGSDKFLLYYRLAYSFKRLGLSFYGEIGNSTSRYFQTKVAEAVTLSGQYFIRKSAQMAERWGLQVLYGDTDSMYIKATDAKIREFCKATDAYYKQLCREGIGGVPFNVDVDNPKKFIVELEYENYFGRIFFVKKKRYAGRMTMFKDKPSDILEVKGLEMMRSDGLQFARNMQKEVMEKILWCEPEKRGRLAKDIAQLLVDRCSQVMSGTLPVDVVQMTQAIEKDVSAYKSNPPHVRIARHIQEVAPTEYFPGMKVPYVVLDDKKKEAIWSVEYDPAEHSYDAQFVWDNKVYPQTYRVLKVALPEYDWGKLFIARTPPKSAEDKDAE